MASVPVFANSDFNITGSDLIALCMYRQWNGHIYNHTVFLENSEN